MRYSNNFDCYAEYINMINKVIVLIKKKFKVFPPFAKIVQSMKLKN